MVLTRFERNQVYEIIAQSDINVADCGTYASADSTYFAHKSGSEFVFQLTGVSSNNVPLFAIGAQVFDGDTPRMPQVPIPINLAAPYIDAWAAEIKRVSETPDYWAEMQPSRELIENIQHTGTGNTPFTQDEQRQIAAQLQEITKQLKEQFELTKEQIERIEVWRDESTEAGKRMGRKDWRIYFLGTITELIITATLPSGVGEHIFTMVVHGLIHLFTGAPPQVIT
jgi:hypothetical protein